jgi:RND superfamily putative drug exporter
VYRWRWCIIVVWTLGLLVSLPFVVQLPSVLQGGGYSFSGSESVQVQNMVVEKLHQPPAQLMIVLQSAQTPVTNVAYQREINAVIAAARRFASGTTVVPGGVGPDGRTTYLVVNFTKSSSYVQGHLNDFRDALSSAATAGPAQFYLTGELAVYAEFNQIGQQDTEQADAIALPIALVVLLIVFGTVIAAVMPILLAVVAVPIALAVVYGIAEYNTTNVIILTVASVIGLGLSIDYSLFLVRRFREELERRRPVPDAVAWTLATSGEAIFFSGITVLVGFFGLVLIGISFMASLGIGGAVVVGVAMLGALTLLPAILGVLGPRINAVRLPVLKRPARLPAQGSARNGVPAQERLGFWHTWAMWVMRRPVLILLVVVALLLGMGWPVLSMQIGVPAISSLPASSQVRQGLDILHAQFPATNQNPISIIAQSPDGNTMLTSANLVRLDQLSQWLAQQPHITSVTSLTRLPSGASSLTTAELITLYSTGAYQQYPALAQLVASTTAGNTTLITVQTNTTLDSQQGVALINSLRAGDTAAGQGLHVLVGGVQAVTVDFDHYLYERFPLAILFVLLTTFCLLLVMFRSLVLPLKAVLTNVLSIGVAYGVLVFVFQWGHLAGLLGFTSEGFVESPIPIMMFCILFGLSMDYEVFLLSRIREEWLRAGNNRFAVARGLEKTGSVITNAALIFVIVSGAIACTTLISTKEIGLGMAVAVLVDATIIRSLLVPATMRLLGRWNWWLPGRPLPPKGRA